MAALTVLTVLATSHRPVKERRTLAQVDTNAHVCGEDGRSTRIGLPTDRNDRLAHSTPRERARSHPSVAATFQYSEGDFRQNPRLDDVLFGSLPGRNQNRSRTGVFNLTISGDLGKGHYQQSGWVRLRVISATCEER